MIMEADAQQQRQQPPAKIQKMAESEQELVMRALKERLEIHNDNKKKAEGDIKISCKVLKAQINVLEKRLIDELEERFIEEDKRLRTALARLRRNNNSNSALRKAKAALLVMQSYDLVDHKSEKQKESDSGGEGERFSFVEFDSDSDDDYDDEFDDDEFDDDEFDDDEFDDDDDGDDDDENNEEGGLNEHKKCNEDKLDNENEEEKGYEDKLVDKILEATKEEESMFYLATLFDLKTERRIVPEVVEIRKPTNVRAIERDGNVYVRFTCFNHDEEGALFDFIVEKQIKYVCKIFKKGSEQDGKEYIFGKREGYCFILTPDVLEAETTYGIRVKVIVKDIESEWSDVSEFTTEKDRYCIWKKCPGYVIEGRKYEADKEDPRILTKINDSDVFYHCTAVGNTPIPLNAVTSWNVKTLLSRGGGCIFIGVAPSNINQNEDYNFDKCGWYFDCHDSTLRSGPPHNYEYKIYGPVRGGYYTRAVYELGVIMDTTKGELSFALDGANCGIAYEGIPLDKPLVPCVLIHYQYDSVLMDAIEIKDNVDGSVPVPPNIVAKCAWDTITLTWDKDKNASFYQIVVDESKYWNATTINKFIKGGLLAETEHSFRVRTVRKGAVSEWSDIIKKQTLKIPAFSGCVWKECPVDIDGDRRFSIDEENPSIATKSELNVESEYCSIIGNKPVPLNAITSWSVKILKSKKNDGNYIYIGVAPFDINQNYDNYYYCGWYFGCYESALCSGPPHKYSGKKYGLRKGNGRYVHTGDSVGVVINTTNGELSFALNGANLGVAYEGIPFDKPLVPCVLLKKKGDSIELDTSEVKENMDSSVPVPSNISAKFAWDTIELTWDEVADALFYQIEVDGSKYWNATPTNKFAKGGLPAETEHSFRVRTVRGSSVSEWSNVVKGKTLNIPVFSGCVWKECPIDIDDKRKYSVDEKNPRIATKVNDGMYGKCTVIGSKPLPPDTVTSWSVKILNSKNTYGHGICIGIAQFDIDQNVNSYYKCGWYFDCHNSTLLSGPPHKYDDKAYGPRKRWGEYVQTGDSVGVVIDTTNGELSFVLDGANLGVAYEGIPFDKPLVPCVILWNKGDSVELII